MASLSFRSLESMRNPLSPVEDAAGALESAVSLLTMTHKGFEQRLTVTLANEKLVSFLITAITTTFGTIYSAVLVFLTQRLATRRNLQKDQMLTATHDNIAAWAGIGAALSLLWDQGKFSSRGSVMGVLCAVTYLAAVLGLHITSSSLFSLVAFNSNHTSGAITQGLPVVNGTFDTEELVIYEELITYAVGSLAFLPSVLNNPASPGLHGSTLYDVPNAPSSVPGNASVDATGFNMTCGFLPVPTPLVFSAERQAYSWDVSAQQEYANITSTQPGIVSHSMPPVFFFYSTIPIMDSNGNRGPLVELSPPMNTSVSSIQVFRCALTLVSQVAVLDSQTQQILSVEPDLTKTTSKWSPYTVNSEFQLQKIWYPNVTDNALGTVRVADYEPIMASIMKSILKNVIVK
ncbi:hypothetical protein C8R45DRAFT_931333 [Mycena sanguinolenta]|nr:hypothetical protein C8R45DRAFT_931333 [Mycena sanguinolenta]